MPKVKARRHYKRERTFAPDSLEILDGGAVFTCCSTMAIKTAHRHGESCCVLSTPGLHPAATQDVGNWTKEGSLPFLQKYLCGLSVVLKQNVKQELEGGETTAQERTPAASLKRYVADTPLNNRNPGVTETARKTQNCGYEIKNSCHASSPPRDVLPTER